MEAPENLASGAAGYEISAGRRFRISITVQHRQPSFVPLIMAEKRWPLSVIDVFREHEGEQERPAKEGGNNG